MYSCGWYICTYSILLLITFYHIFMSPMSRWLPLMLQDAVEMGTLFVACVTAMLDCKPYACYIIVVWYTVIWLVRVKDLYPTYIHTYIHVYIYMYIESLVTTYRIVGKFGESVFRKLLASFKFAMTDTDRIRVTLYRNGWQVLNLAIFCKLVNSPN